MDPVTGYPVFGVFFEPEPVTYLVTVNNGTGGGEFAADVTVTVTADIPQAGMVFDKWIVNAGGVTLADMYDSETTFIMPAEEVTITATYKPITYLVVVNNGTGGGEFTADATVTITADIPQAGMVFDKWITSDGVEFADANNATTTFTMIGNAVIVTATYKDAPVPTYEVTVINGTGGGDHEAGETVTITADVPPAGMVFDKWIVNAGGITFADEGSLTTTFIMPAEEVTVTATYKTEPKEPEDGGAGGIGDGGSGSGGAGDGSTAGKKGSSCWLFVALMILFFLILIWLCRSEKIEIEPIDDKEYTGSHIRPTPWVKYYGTFIEAGKDFVYSYGENEKLGIGTVTVTLIDGNKGEATATFRIVNRRT
jgi:hypothetical protein